MKGLTKEGNGLPEQALTQDVIKAAIVGFEQQKQSIDAKIGELRKLLVSHSVPVAPPTAGRRTMSAEGRSRIAEAQRKRWAAQKKYDGSAAAAKKPKTKRALSPEGRQRIIEATKKRWAAFRAGKKVAK